MASLGDWITVPHPKAGYTLRASEWGFPLPLDLELCRHQRIGSKAHLAPPQPHTLDIGTPDLAGAHGLAISQ